MPRLSLCLIARDEAPMLAGCIESVRGVVDEVVLVDTGSTDGTVDLARKLGARVFEQPWRDDFSAPRNLSLAHATGDWVLQLDADERLTADAGRAIREAIASGGFDCGMLRLHDAARLDAPPQDVVSGAARLGEAFHLPRLLRKTPDLEYRGVIHECVTDWLERRGMKVRSLDGDIVHLGNVPEVKAAKQKQLRNLALLRKRCELEPENVGPYGYLALELLNAGLRDEAREVVARAWPLVQRRPKNRMVLRVADVRATLQLEKGDAHGALETVALGEELEGVHPDLSHLKGCANELLGLRAPTGSRRRARALNDALAAFDAALRFETAPSEGLAAARFLDGSTGFASQTRRGNVLLALGRAEDAARAFGAALELRPGHDEARLGLAESLLELGAPDRALALLEGVAPDRPDGWLLAAAAVEQQGSLADASRFFTQAAQRFERGYLTQRRVERHVSAACALSAYQGQPQPGPGPIGALTALMARKPAYEPGPVACPSARVLRTFVLNLLSAERNDLVEALLEPRAAQLIPALPAALRTLLAELGAVVEDDGQRPPLTMHTDDAALVEPLSAMLSCHPRWAPSSGARPLRLDTSSSSRSAPVRWVRAAGPTRRDGATLELSYPTLLARPAETLAELSAFLGEPTDDGPLRWLVENYPGAST